MRSFVGQFRAVQLRRSLFSYAFDRQEMISTRRTISHPFGQEKLMLGEGF